MKLEKDTTNVLHKVGHQNVAWIRPSNHLLPSSLPVQVKKCRFLSLLLCEDDLSRSYESWQVA